MRNELFNLKKMKSPEVTTSMLMAAFSDYEDVRGKITSLSKKKLIQQVKQGVYLLNQELGFRPYSKEILANLIYGPSYISLETALSHYGFIPERVTQTTSVCLGRAKSFSTSVGEFEYYHIKDELYPVGVQLKEIFSDSFCLYAVPEKALLDFIYLKEKKGEFKNAQDYFKYILDSYRLDTQTIQDKISLKKLQTFSELYPFQHVHWFASELIRKLL